MSEETPIDPDAANDEDADAPKGKPRKDAKPVSERDAAVAHLAQLQKDYDQLRDKVRQAPSPAAGVGAEALARKSEVAREIVAIKQRHNLA